MVALANLGTLVPGGKEKYRSGWIAAGCPYIGPAVEILTLTTAVLSTNIMYLVPFRFQTSGTVTHICTETTSGTNTMRAGLYQVTSAAVSLLQESAATTPGGTGFIEIALTSSVSVTPGETYLAALAVGTGNTHRAIATSIGQLSDWPVPIAITTTDFGAWIDPHTLGALPSTSTITDNSASATGYACPLLYVKMSA